MPNGKTKKKPRRTRRRVQKRLGWVRSVYSDFSKPMPGQLKCRLKYATANLVLTSGATATNYIFSTTDLFDPNVSGAGHQCLGYDEMGAFYRQWRVTGCRYKVTFFGAGADGMKVLVFPHRAAATIPVSTIEVLSEMSRAKMKVISTDTPMKDGVFSGYINNARVLGITPEKYRVDDVYSGTTTTSPIGAGVDLLLSMQYRDNASNINCNVHVELLYDCVFWGTKVLSQS